MAAITKDEILDAIASMTVLEASELVKAMEEKFGVTAAATVVAAAVQPAAVKSNRNLPLRLKAPILQRKLRRLKRCAKLPAWD